MTRSRNRPNGRPSAQSRRHSVGIIGGGIVGICCALHLQRSGHEVEVIDFRRPGDGASSGNAGIIALSEVIPLSTPATLARMPSLLFSRTSPLRIRPFYLPSIAPWLFRFLLACRPERVLAIETALQSLLSNAWDSWIDVVRGTPGEALLDRSGWLQLFETPESFSRRRAAVDTQRQFGINVEEIGASEIQQLEPALPPRFARGLYYPDSGLVRNPGKIVQLLAEGFVSKGGIYRRERALGVVPSEAGAVQIATDHSIRAYDSIVIAAGAWSRPFVKALGFDMPLDTERGYHLMLPKSVTLHRSVNFPEYGFSLTPMGDEIRLTSGLEFAGLDAEPDFRRIQDIARAAEVMIPGLDGTSTSRWLGFRPSFPDSLPVIGALRHYPSVFVAFGHGHLGLTVGPFTGKLLANIIDGHPLPIDMVPFSPERWT